MKLKTTITNAIVYSTYNDDNNISFDLYYDFETVHNELGIGIKLSNVRAEGILEEMVMPVMEFVIDEYVRVSSSGGLNLWEEPRLRSFLTPYLRLASMTLEAIMILS